MKNFRKVLALVLVVATLFSFVAMASAKTSADYSDVASIKYVEAVDVLSAVGILKGYDGAYHPGDFIDRDEMAKMIAVLRNGGEDNAILFSGANKFADVKGTWAEGYIAYCAQLGIVSGRNATTFDPDGKVTGTEVLKMLLVVLGYDAQEQGYVGTNWQTNVLRDAVKMDLLEGLEGFDPYKAATRDEAAQMMLNALKANMVVGYLSDSLVKITNSLYAFFNENEDGIVSSPDAEKKGWEITYCNAVISLTPLYTIVPGLDLDFARDCYGRPGYKWTYKPTAANAVFSKQYTMTADKKLVSPSANDIKNNANALSNLAFTSWTTFVDGKEGATYTSGNGTVVELYAYDKTDFDRDDFGTYGDIVVINTYIDKVAKVSEYYNYFTLTGSQAKYKLGSNKLASGQYVLYHLCGANGTDLHDVKVVEPVVANVTEGYNYTTVVADGQTYKYSNTYNTTIGGASKFDMAVIKAQGTLHDLYLDEHGFIIYNKKHVNAATTSYVVIEENNVTRTEGSEKVDANGNLVPSYSYSAVVAPYGTDGVVTPAATAIDKGSFEYMQSLNKVYNLSSNNKKALPALVMLKNGAKSAVADFAPVGTRLDNETFALKEGEIYANSKTVFMIRPLPGDTLNSYAYEQVTGYKNLKGVYVAEDVTDGTNTYTNIQYFANDKGFATYVFIDARYTTGAENFMILAKDHSATGFVSKYAGYFGADYAVYSAIVDGQKGLLLADDSKVASSVEVAAGTAKPTQLLPGYLYEDTLVYLGVEIALDGKSYPVYVAADIEAGADNKFASLDYYYVVDDGEVYVKINGKVYEMAENAVIWSIVSKDNKLMAENVYIDITQNDIGDSLHKGYIVLNDAGQVEALYQITAIANTKW